MRKRKWAGAVVAGTVLALVSACSSTSYRAGVAEMEAAPSYTGTLSILTASAGDPLGKYFPGVVKEYERLHPGVHIDLAQQTDDDAIKNKEKVLIAAQALPDIYFTYAGNWGANFADGGVAMPLDSVIGPGTAWGSTFLPSAVDAFEYDGTHYGVPLYLDAKYMGYNKRIFRKLGLSVPETLDQLIDSCGVIRKAGYIPIAFGNGDGWPGVHYLGQLVAHDVPEQQLAEDEDPATASYSDPGYVQAMEEYQRLVATCTSERGGANGVDYTTAQQQQTTGRAAMYYQELVEFDSVNAAGSRIAKDGLGIFPLPSAPGNRGDARAVEGAPEGFMINRRSRHTALALDFLKFLTSRENAQTLSATPYGQPSAVIGAVNPRTASAPVVEGVEQIKRASRLDVWLDMGSVPTVADVWTTASQTLISGSSTPRQVLAQLRAAAKEAQR